MTGSRHWKLMQEYAEDAEFSPEPWLSWECSFEGLPWVKLACHPHWIDRAQYRRRVPTIDINGFDVPKPMCEPPPNGSVYYAVNYLNIIGSPPPQTWSSVERGYMLLSMGICHLSVERAVIHRDALLSFTRRDKE